MESGATLPLPVPVPCHRTRDNPGRGWREDATTAVGKELWGFWSEPLLPQALQLERERGSSERERASSLHKHLTASHSCLALGCFPLPRPEQICCPGPPLPEVTPIPQIL